MTFMTSEAGLFSWGDAGVRVPLNHFVNLTGESKNLKMLDFPVNKLQILSLTAFIFSNLNYKIVIFLSQTESTPKHFVNLTGESKNFKMLEFQLQMCYGYLCDLCQLTAFIFSDLNYKIVIFFSQTESTPKHFFRKKALVSSLHIPATFYNQV
jgi:hypothetical protein